MSYANMAKIVGNCRRGRLYVGRHKKGIKVITVKKPAECSASELKDFAAFVLTGGEVTAIGLESRIKNAESLLLHRGGHEIIRNISGFSYPVKIVVSLEENSMTVITNYPLKKGRKK